MEVRWAGKQEGRHFQAPHLLPLREQVLGVGSTSELKHRGLDSWFSTRAHTWQHLECLETFGAVTSAGRDAAAGLWWVGPGMLLNILKAQDGPRDK